MLCWWFVVHKSHKHSYLLLTIWTLPLSMNVMNVIVLVWTLLYHAILEHHSHCQDFLKAFIFQLLLLLFHQTGKSDACYYYYNKSAQSRYLSSIAGRWLVVRLFALSFLIINTKTTALQNPLASIQEDFTYSFPHILIKITLDLIFFSQNIFEKVEYLFPINSVTVCLLR